MVLTAIASLGDIGEKGLTSLVNRSGARDCLEIIFNKSDCSLFGCELTENKGETKYLYHWDKSGKPGLFLSWTISAADVKRFQDLSKSMPKLREDANQLADFWKKKFGWFSNPGSTIINNDGLMQAIDEDSRSFLQSLRRGYTDSFDKIRAEAGRKLGEYVFGRDKGTNKLLVTIAFREDSETKYPGDIPSFKRLFTRAVSGDVFQDEGLTCTVCNSRRGGALTKQVPLEFMTQDQLVYIPDGNPLNKGRAIALCQDCSDRLRAGQTFINSNLSFRIIRSNLFFWLVPVVPDVASVKQYILDLAGKMKPLYLRDLRGMCEDMEMVSEHIQDVEEASEAEAWLSFVSLFCYKDRLQTRISGMVEGVYPSRLRELVKASWAVQRRYPYFLVKPKVKFSFPLLSRFFAGERGEATITQVMESLFTYTPVNTARILRILVDKVRSHGLTQFKGAMVPPRRRMKDFVTTVLNALIVMEYLAEAGILSFEQESAVLLMENVLKDQHANEIQKFIASHRYLEKSETAKSIFLTGVAVGVLLEVQMKEFGSYPFWKHLNRLELDVPRIMSFYPQVKAKLAQYAKGKAAHEIKVLRPMIEFIGANLNFEKGPMSVDVDSVDLVFAIGLSEGYLIYYTASGRNE